PTNPESAGTFGNRFSIVRAFLRETLSARNSFVIYRARSLKMAGSSSRSQGMRISLPPSDDERKRQHVVLVSTSWPSREITLGGSGGKSQRQAVALRAEFRIRSLLVELPVEPRKASLACFASVRWM